MPIAPDPRQKDNPVQARDCRLRRQGRDSWLFPFPVGRIFRKNPADLRSQPINGALDTLSRKFQGRNGRNLARRETLAVVQPEDLAITLGSILKVTIDLGDQYIAAERLFAHR